MEKSIQRFLRYHRSIGSSPKTVIHHDQSLNGLRRFLEGAGYSTSIDAMKADMVREWLDDQRDRGLSPSTLATRTRSVKAFFNWLVGEEWLKKNPLVRLTVPRESDAPKPTLDPAQVDKLLATCNLKTGNGLRDYAIMLMLYSTGLRVGELVALKNSDVDQLRGLITVRNGKGGKYRVVPLGKKVDRALDRYLSRRSSDGPEGALFLTDELDPITYVTVREMLRRRGGNVGIHVNPHMFRHSFAIAYLRAGGKLETLRAIMGHSDFEITLHYARIAGVDISTAHTLVDPTLGLKSK